jgi:hypothetical protein
LLQRRIAPVEAAGAVRQASSPTPVRYLSCVEDLLYTRGAAVSTFEARLAACRLNVPAYEFRLGEVILATLLAIIIGLLGTLDARIGGAGSARHQQGCARQNCRIEWSH